MCGLLALKTLGPTDEKGLRASLEYGTANAVKARLSWFVGHHALSLGFRHTDGYFRNSSSWRKQQSSRIPCRGRSKLLRTLHSWSKMKQAPFSGV